VNCLFRFSFFLDKGPKAKASCMTVFSERGCKLCLKIFDNPDSLRRHKEACCLSAPAPLVS
ncbi:hypothetical protein Q8G48_29025, partial [Klebsiella pneumoniae]|uniref:hypothetical protein n=1 Tax=Klebsiella pneumoniae TaxID=573 RepID=UPI003013A89E